MQALRAQVRGGRLVLDEPTDLPEGQVVELVPMDDLLANGGDYLDDADRAALHRSIDAGIDDFEQGETEDAFNFLARLKAVHEDRDRQARPSAGGARK